MKKTFFFLVLIVVVGAIGFSQVSLRVNPPSVPPYAPFEITVNPNLTNVSTVTVIFDGITKVMTNFPFYFTFNAPELKDGHATNLTVNVTVWDRDGKSYFTSSKVEVSDGASPVLSMGKPSGLSGNNLSGTVDFPIEVYSGPGTKKIEFMIDSSVASVVNVKSTETSKVIKKTFSVDTKALSNGWHVFSLKLTNDNGAIFSKINAYVVDNEPPEITLETPKITALKAATCVNFEVSANSTLGDVQKVTFNGVQAERTSRNLWQVCLTTPKKTGNWTVNVVAIDQNGNATSKAFDFFVDGSAPSFKILNDARFTEKTNGQTVLWKRETPLRLTVAGTSESEKVGVNPHVSVKANGVSVSQNVILTRSGRYDISVVATDPISDLSTTLKENLDVRFDSVPPTLESFKILPDRFVNGEGYTVVSRNATITIRVKADDGNGIGISDVLLSTTSPSVVSGNTWDFTLPKLEPGPNDLKMHVRMADRIGNATMVNIVGKIFVDVNPPKISYSVPKNSMDKNGVYLVKDRPFALNVNSTTDSGIRPEVTNYVNGKKTEGPVQFEAPGTYEVTTVATNPVNGLSTTARRTFRVGFDDRPPTVNSFETNPPKAIGPDATVVATVRATDTGTGIRSLSINGIEAVRTGDLYTVKLRSPDFKKSGEWSLNLTTGDYFGNSTTVVKKLFVDVNPPRVSLDFFPNEYYRNGTYWGKNMPFFIRVKAETDSGIKPDVLSTINGQKISEATLVYNSGIYNIDVIATNPVNDLSTKFERKLSLGFDRQPPEIFLVTAPATMAPDRPATIEVDVKDSGIGVETVKVNGLPMTNVATNLWKAVLSSPQLTKSGYWPLKFTSSDKFGNTSDKTFRTFVDANPPTIRLFVGNNEVGNGFDGVFYSKKEPVLRYSATTDGGVAPGSEMYLDCGVKANNSVNISGTHFVTVVSTDPVNGLSTKLIAKFTVMVDGTSPVLGIKAPETIKVGSDAKVQLSIKEQNLKYAFFTVTTQQGTELYSDVYGSEGTKTVNLDSVLSGINGKEVKLVLRAVDLAGNESETEKTVYVDTVSPYVENVALNSNGYLVITFNENVFGKPKVEVMSKDGKTVLSGNGTITGNKVIVYEFDNGTKIPTSGAYTLKVDGITDNGGNPVNNNDTSWEF